MRFIAAGLMIGLLTQLASCSSTTPRCACPCHDRHAAVANAAVANAARANSDVQVATSQASASATAADPSGSYRPPLRTGNTGYVRLRGSRPIHVSSCLIVRRALPDGITPAGRHDGPPCFTCRRSEALAATR